MTYSNKTHVTLSPSQVLNLPIIILGIATIPIGIFTLIALYKILEYYYWRYEFNEHTLVERKGVFDVTRKELHYYRIKSVYMEEPFLFRIFGLSNLYIKTSDPYLPELKLYGVRFGKAIKNELESITYSKRKEENVREFDLFKLNEI